MSVKNFLKSTFPALIGFRNRLYNDIVHRRFRDKPIDQVFNTIYEENHWNDSESKSGTGSNLEQTREVKRILKGVLEDFTCRKILDLPCGDFNWIRDVDFGDCHYYGADIVKPIVEANKASYSAPRRDFFFADLTSSDLPSVDVVFCRDCLVHLSYKDIAKALANIKRSGSTYLLTTTFVDHTNRDIVTGNWRPVNLRSVPFMLPEPIQIFNEKCTEGGNRYADKSLALWRIADLTCGT